MIDPCTIADIIRTECDRQGRSLRAVCRKAGVSHGAVVRWGGTLSAEPLLPSLRILQRICAVLRLPVWQVIMAAESEHEETCPAD